MLRRRLYPSGSGGAIPGCTSATPDGSPLVIVNDSAPHNGFPDVARINAGLLILVYRKGTSHSAGLDGYLVARYSSDNGATWTAEETIWNPTDSARDPAVRVMSSGTVLVSTTSADGETLNDDFFGYVLRSTDNGSTWSSPIAFGTTYGTGGNHREVGGSPIIELDNGTLMAPIAGRTAAQSSANESVIVVFSDDDGLTWGDEVSVLEVSGQFYTEPYVVKLPNGTLHMLIRRNDTGNIYRTTSSDDGQTWTTATIAFSGRGKPAHAQFGCGTILYVSRPSPTGDTEYRLSSNDGATWTSAVTLDTHLTNNAYAGMVSLGRNSMLCVYGVELVDGSDGDIRSQVFTAS